MITLQLVGDSPGAHKGLCFGVSFFAPATVHIHGPANDLPQSPLAESASAVAGLLGFRERTGLSESFNAPGIRPGC